MLTFRVKLEEQKVFYSYYCSPSQSRQEFDKFLGNFEVLIKTISNQKDAISIMMADFNAWSSNWCKYDVCNNEGVQIVTSLDQLIYESTHILTWFLQMNRI